MKINYVIFGSGLTGGTRVIFEIANQLVERGHDVTITTLGSPTSLWWIKPKAKVNFVEKFFLGRKIVEHFAGQYLVKPLLDKKLNDLVRGMPDCDINVATFCMSAYAVLKSGKGIPFYHMQHDETLFFPSDQYSYQLADKTYNLPLNKIANCLWLKERMEKKYQLSSLPVVNPAIDHQVFYPRPEQKSGDKFRVISLGKDVAIKGLDTLFKAMKIVAQQRKNVELVLYEKAKWSYPELEVPYTFVKGPANDELAKLYCSCDLLVSSSHYESFPLPQLEAMACGLPVVTTRYGTEDYAFDGKNALVLPPKDPERLAAAIIKLVDDKALRERFIKEGLRTAAQFTWENAAKKVEKIFEDAIVRAKESS